MPPVMVEPAVLEPLHTLCVLCYLLVKNTTLRYEKNISQLVYASAAEVKKKCVSRNRSEKFR